MLEIRTDEGNVYDLKKLQKILTLVYNVDYVMDLNYEGDVKVAKLKKIGDE
jgi:hypothetical protein